ncbi:hypothetical protein [Bradyrhizobium sp. STM 3557]|uniref:hypothetical protein n=1 Tax=Bradyrhizobium sp. STM 3557 TaxID=578920 RepID=UPI0038905078
MTGDDIRKARVEPGRMWKAGGGPLTAQELVRALGLSERHGTDHVYNMDAVPPDDVEIFDWRRMRGNDRCWIKIADQRGYLS